MIKFQKRKFLVICLSVFGTLAVNLTTLAVTWPSVPSTGTGLDPHNTDLSGLIKYIYEWSIILGGLSIFIILVIAGIQYLTSAGSPGQMALAKERIGSAVLGLVLLLGSFLILNIINPVLLDIQSVDLSDLNAFNNCKNGDIVKIGEEEKELKGSEYCQYFFGEDYRCDERGICVTSLKHLWAKKNCKNIEIAVRSAEGLDSSYKSLKVGKKPHSLDMTITESDIILYKIPDEESECYAKLILCNNENCTDPADSFILAPPKGTIESFSLPLEKEKEYFLPIKYIILEKAY